MFPVGVKEPILVVFFLSFFSFYTSNQWHYLQLFVRLVLQFLFCFFRSLGMTPFPRILLAQPSAAQNGWMEVGQVSKAITVSHLGKSLSL
jgi:hypothetical protein